MATTESWGEDWSQTPTNELARQPGQSAGDRLRSAFQNMDPAVKARAVGVATTIGREAALGSGLLKDDGEGGLRVSKRGVIKTAMNPANMLRKAAQGGARAGIQEARSQAKSVAVDVAREQAMNAFSAIASPNAAPQSADTGWGVMPTTEASNTGWNTPVESGVDDYWNTPTPPQAQNLADSWNQPATSWGENTGVGWDTPAQPATPDWGAQVPPAQYAASAAPAQAYPGYNANSQEW